MKATEAGRRSILARFFARQGSMRRFDAAKDARDQPPRPGRLAEAQVLEVGAEERVREGEKRFVTVAALVPQQRNSLRLFSPLELVVQ